MGFRVALFYAKEKVLAWRNRRRRRRDDCVRFSCRGQHNSGLRQPVGDLILFTRHVNDFEVKLAEYFLPSGLPSREISLF